MPFTDKTRFVWEIRAQQRTVRHVQQSATLVTQTPAPESPIERNSTARQPLTPNTYASATTAHVKIVPIQLRNHQH